MPAPSGTDRCESNVRVPSANSRPPAVSETVTSHRPPGQGHHPAARDDIGDTEHGDIDDELEAHSGQCVGPELPVDPWMPYQAQVAGAQRCDDGAVVRAGHGRGRPSSWCWRHPFTRTVATPQPWPAGPRSSQSAPGR